MGLGRAVSGPSLTGGTGSAQAGRLHPCLLSEVGGAQIRDSSQSAAARPASALSVRPLSNARW